MTSADEFLWRPVKVGDVVERHIQAWKDRGADPGVVAHSLRVVWIEQL